MLPKITALKVQKRNHQRINVYLDGQFAFGLARIVAAWLHLGQELTEEKIAELRAQDSLESAYQLALNFLSYRERSRAEISRHLDQHEIDSAICDEILIRLEKNGLLDDSRFARTWAENRTQFRPRSRRMLAYELRRKGLDDQDIQQAIEQVDDEALAYQAALGQSRKLAKLEWQDYRKKMYAYLARRGFSHETAAPVTARVWAETHTIEETKISIDEEVDSA